MKKPTLLFYIFLFSVSSVRSQGCIIVRNISGYSHYNFKDYAYTSSNWVMDITGRYFKSYKDYKGGTNLNVPKADRSINYIFTTDFTITKFLKDGWGLSLNIPITSNRRSTTNEHGGTGKPRHETQSFGLGDARFTVYK